MSARGGDLLWLGPVWRDGRWWAVREDGDQVTHTAGDEWRPGWPRPTGWRPGLVRLLILVVLVVLLAVPGWLILVGRICLLPECGFHPVVAVQHPTASGRLPEVLAAPCARSAVDQVTVERVARDGSRTERLLALVRLGQGGGDDPGGTGGAEGPGGSGRKTFPLDRVVAGYRVDGSPEHVLAVLDGLRKREKAALDALSADRRPPPVDPDQVRATVRYADGASGSELLGTDLTGSLRYQTGGPSGNVLTGADFAASAAGADVCLPPGVRPEHYLPLLALALLAAGAAVAVRSRHRGRYAGELVRQARAEITSAAAGRG